jgi:hypothetical protein
MFSTYAMSIFGMCFAAASALTLFWYVDHVDDGWKDESRNVTTSTSRNAA